MSTDLHTRIMQAISDAAHSTRFMPYLELDGRFKDIAADCEVDVREIVKNEMGVVTDHVRQQAAIWEQEAWAQKTTVDAVGVSFGGVSDWGPIVQGVQKMADRIAKLETALARDGGDRE